MAEDTCSSTCSEEDEGLFANDGNFLERFKRIQEEQKKQKKEEEKKKSLEPKMIKSSKEPTIPMRRRPHPLAKKRTKVSTIDCNTPTQDCPNNSNTGTAMPAASTPTAKGKRKSRWGDPLTSDDHLVVSVISSFESPSKTTIADNIRKVKEQILEQQELNKAVLQIQKATQAHTAIQLEHNSLTKTEKEHLLRLKEMESTAVKAQELTEAAEGKHFVGDFLPADELTKFIEKTNSAKTQTVLSDYSDHKLTQSNIGYQLLQKAGWREGEGIGRNEDGILNPLNKGLVSHDQSGIGISKPGELTKNDNEFDIYRKRMMLAYRFRPNPLNNPRRPYY